LHHCRDLSGERSIVEVEVCDSQVSAAAIAIAAMDWPA
jgi:hypothetical protein